MTMKSLFYTLVFCLISHSFIQAQNVGIGTATPAAKLDVVASDEGVLIPRVALSATNVAAPLTTPTTSELVYNTATAGTSPNNVIPGFYYWNGTQWMHLEDGTSWREFTLDIPADDVDDRIYHRDQVIIGFNKGDGFNGINETDFDASSDAKLIVKGNIMLGDAPDTDPMSGSGIGNFGIKFNSWRAWWNGDKISAKIMTNFTASPGCGDTRVTDLIFSLDPGTRTCTQETDDPTLEVMRIEYGGNVGMGTAAPTARLSVNGTTNKPGGGTWAVFSDARLKKDITPYKEGLDFIRKIKPVNFKYNDQLAELWGMDANIEGQVFQGVIAQDLQKIAPDMVRSVRPRDAQESFLEVDPNKFTYALINAVQQQQEIIERQQVELEQMKLQLDRLNASINKQQF